MTYQVFTPVRAQSLCVAAIFVFGLGAVPVAAADFETRLAPTDASGVPESHAAADWLGAEGIARAIVDGDEHAVTIGATGLVRDGL